MKHVLILYQALAFGVVLLSGCASGGGASTVDKCLYPEIYGSSCVEPDLEEIAKHPLGSFGNPIRVHNPEGEHKYLLRLICSNGDFADFKRTGSAGAGPYGYILDAYAVTCESGSESQTLFMDMYHPKYVEKQAPPGFILYE